MNADDPWWHSSEIQAMVQFDDEEDSSFGNNVTSSKDDVFFLSDVTSGVSISNKNVIRRPSIDLYSLVSKTSVQYILGQSNSEQETFTPFTDKNKSPYNISTDVKLVIDRMCGGNEVCLEPFKSLKSKKELLKHSLAKNNYDVILKVAIFLVKTLKSILINEFFLCEQKLFEVYVNFLISKGDIKKAVELYDILGYNKDAGMLQYLTCCSNTSNQIASLKSISNSHFLMDSDKYHIDNFIKLIEWQTSVDKKLYQSSVAHCLKYTMNSNSTDDRHSSEYVKKLLNVSDRLYYWVFLKEKCKYKKWSDIYQVFVSKKWYGRKSISPSIPVEDILRELYLNEAPERELVNYLQLLSDSEKRLALAKKYKCFFTVVDILIEQKDRQALLLFRSQQTPQSAICLHADIALNSCVKWKN